MQKRPNLALAIILLPLACSYSKPESSLLATLRSDIVALNRPNAGDGYKSESDRWLNSSCMDKTRLVVRAKFSNGQTHSQLVMNPAETLPGEITRDPDMLGFLATLCPSATSAVYLLRKEVSTNEERFPSFFLNADASALSEPQRIKRCGDEYVDQVTLGGLAYVSVVITFLTADERNDFVQKFASADLTKLDETLVKLSPEQQRRLTINLYGFQRGGLSLTTNQILATGNNCSGDNAASCLNSLKAVSAYWEGSFLGEVKAMPSFHSYSHWPYVAR